MWQTEETGDDIENERRYYVTPETVRWRRKNQGTGSDVEDAAPYAAAGHLFVMKPPVADFSDDENGNIKEDAETSDDHLTNAISTRRRCI